MNQDSEEQPTRPVSPAAGHLGLLIKGRYLIDAEIGRGGFGAVYKARDRQLLDKPVVVKILLEESGRDAWFRRKFAQEIEALSRINHPGVVPVLDAGELDTGQPYMVMQFIEGSTLRTHLPAGGLDLPRVANIVRQVGHALSAAHAKGVCHRDLKPENIMLTPGASGVLDEHATLIDFGIAAVAESALGGGGQTRLAGSLAYMAPEQLDGKPVPQSDIYSLGVMVYEMLTGSKPFMPNALLQFLEMQREGLRVKPRSLRPDLPQTAEDMIVRALSYRPQDRFEKASDFGDQLARELNAELMRATVPAGAGGAPRVEVAHVLFIGPYGVTALPADLQSQQLREINTALQQTSAFRDAAGLRRVISATTAHGITVAFPGDPALPVDCALAVFEHFRGRGPSLRAAVHSGPIYRAGGPGADVTAAGAAIETVQKVAAFCGEGQILSSRVMADLLTQLSAYSGRFRGLGQRRAPDGELIEIFALADLGWAEAPPPDPWSRRKWVVAAAGAAGAGAILWRWSRRRMSPQPPAGEALNLRYAVERRRCAALPGECVVIRFRTASQGYLYVINQGPDETGGDALVMAFPASKSQASPFIAAGSSLSTGEFGPYEANGREIMWILWSRDRGQHHDYLDMIRAERPLGRFTAEDRNRILPLLASGGTRSQPDAATGEVVLETGLPMLIHAARL
ncbi:MAG: hypothetical protein FJW40_25570 [Acidobacteria bacterium]|nr:hypothetical protein [Acidobacteriota bacterium]